MKSSYKIALMFSALICLGVIGYYAAQNDARDPDAEVRLAESPVGPRVVDSATPTPPPADAPADSTPTGASPGTDMDSLMSRVRQHLAPPVQDSATAAGAQTSNAPSASVPTSDTPSAAAMPADHTPPTQEPPTLTLNGATAPAAGHAPTGAPPLFGGGAVPNPSPAAMASSSTAPSTSSATAPSPRPAATTAATAITTPSSPANPRTATTAAATARTYTIRSGDTLSSIAIRLYGDEQRWVDIAQANPLVDPTRLKVGQVLRLPDGQSSSAAAAPPAPPSAAAAGQRTYIVRSGDTLSSIAQKTLGDRSKWRQIYNLNREVIGSNENNVQVGTVLKIPAK